MMETEKVRDFEGYDFVAWDVRNRDKPLGFGQDREEAKKRAMENVGDPDYNESRITVVKHCVPEIKDAREDADISQTELAEQLGTDQPRVSDWEAGKREPSNAYKRLLEMELDIELT